MMSEGGDASIKNIFQEDNLDGKNLLEIGFGLGGSAFFVAEEYDIKSLQGLEINPWMVEEEKRRTPPHLKDKLDFHLYHPQDKLIFKDNSFDLIFSKGVLTHLEDKQNLFNELFRVLKPGGIVLIDDWLSPTKGVWSNAMQKMCESDGLSLYAEIEQGYKEVLESTGFSDIKIKDTSKEHFKYNMDIVNSLKKKLETDKNKQNSEQASIKTSISVYQMIADSIKNNELLTRKIRCIKK